MSLDRDELRAKMTADFAKMRTQTRRGVILVIYAAVFLFVSGIALGFYLTAV